MKKYQYKLIMIIFILIVMPLFTWAANKEDADLDFLPPANNENSTKIEKNIKKNAAPAFSQLENNSFKVILDNTLQATDWKDQSELIFKYPVQSNADWSNLTRLGLRSDISLTNALFFKTDMLLNAYTRESKNFTTSKDLRLDIKEIYLSLQQSFTQFWDIGRINIKNGVATGFNPTDYFKVGTVLDRNTEDISQLRDARLGALLIKTQKLWDSGSLTIVASPEINDGIEMWYSDKDITGLNLHKSNDRSRALIMLTHEIRDGFSPEIIYYNGAGNHNLGVNISRIFNKQWFSYLEWNIGKRLNLLDETFLDLRNTNQLSPAIRQQFPEDNGKHYQQQLAVGTSYTSLSNITTKFEYHYNEAGLSKTDRDKWFNLGSNAQNDFITTEQLLSVRSTAQLQGEPLGKHRFFFNSNWTDAGIDDVDLTALVIIDLNDKSLLTQLEAIFTPNAHIELSLRYARYYGDKESIYGSLDQVQTVSLQIEYDF